MSAPVSLYREIDALGGTGGGEWHAGYVAAISEVLNVLERRGFSESQSPGPMTPDQARALFLEHCEPGDLSHYGEKAAVAAILAAMTVADGFVLVPHKPTQAMLDNAYDMDATELQRRSIWACMIAAAPQVPA
jgi:hypothetical protein